MWYVILCFGSVCICELRMRSCGNTSLKVQIDYLSSFVFHKVRAGAYCNEIHGICAWKVTKQTGSAMISGVC